MWHKRGAGSSDAGCPATQEHRVHGRAGAPCPALSRAFLTAARPRRCPPPGGGLPWRRCRARVPESPSPPSRCLTLFPDGHTDAAATPAAAGPAPPSVPPRAPSHPEPGFPRVPRPVSFPPETPSRNTDFPFFFFFFNCSGQSRPAASGAGGGRGAAVVGRGCGLCWAQPHPAPRGLRPATVSCTPVRGLCPPEPPEPGLPPSPWSTEARPCAGPMAWAGAPIARRPSPGRGAPACALDAEWPPRNPLGFCANSHMGHFFLNCDKIHVT
ncbi:unnamed protein product [Nyctereutes procyonoides]|uniref:(raccoon dog) hypothetical protein n=1 Tax=Nyctereutes procyonoides TaxID=34880 RepID=A0A811ZAY7_NYCPR|nr:unnamed protein product [Nyctereutes procyonoides]